LNDLQKLGVVHVIEKGSGELENEELQNNYLQIKELRKAIKFLNDRKPEQLEAPGKSDTLTILENLNSLQAEQEKLSQDLIIENKELAAMGPWGNFDWKDIKKLEEGGLQTRFFSCNINKYEDSIEGEYYTEIISTEGSHVNFVLFDTAENKTEIDAEELALPIKSLDEIEKQIIKAKEQIVAIEEEYRNIAQKHLRLLEQAKDKISKQLAFDKVILNTRKEAEEKLMVLEGWAPKDTEPDLERLLNEKGIYYESTMPEKEDHVPIKLKNNRFAKLYEAIGELYTFPDYAELDLTPFFAPFFMLFFGFCLGDAGYGLLILVATIIGVYKVKPSLKPIMKLGMYLGLATVIMGIVSGTFFGIMLLDVEWQWIQKYKGLMLNSNKLMTLSLILGYIQIVFGMFLKAFNKIRMYGIHHGISQFGWIIIVIATIPSIAAIKMELVSPETGRQAAIISGVIGGIPALFYNSPGKNVFLNLGIGVWDAYGMASGLLGDLLSYIRLFALGISSAVLGSVFNNLAFNLSPDTIILKQLVILLILAFGHSLNLFMAALGSFVHPLRLTFVEFYKNAGFMGGGKKYQPFTK